MHQMTRQFPYSIKLCYAHTILVTSLCFGLTYLGWPLLHEAPFSLAVISTALLAWRCGIGYAIFCGASNALLVDYILVSKEKQFDGSLTIYIVLSIATAALATWARNQNLFWSKKSDRLSQDVALRDVFISTAAHELRNPFHVLKMRVDLMLRDRSQIESQLPLLTIQLNRLLSVMDNLLDASRIIDGKLVLKKEHVGICALIVSVVSRLGANNFQVILPAHEIEGVWDKFLVENVVSNVLQNAVKYGDPTKPAEVTVREENGTVRIAVKDYGEGIPTNRLEDIFKKYHRLPSKDSTGLGIGLWVVKETLQALGGTISVSSSSTGTEFVIHLPLLDAAAEKVSQAFTV